jgi:hypothetical protein
MKQKFFLLAILTTVLLGSCQKDLVRTNLAHVIVQIDYLSDGGSYNDNIDGVPYGLRVGSNGPFEVDASKNYWIEYYPNSNWTSPARIDNWTPTANTTWVIHCYVTNNLAHVETYPR